jgi:hypothetical protein
LIACCHLDHEAQRADRMAVFQATPENRSREARISMFGDASKLAQLG